MTGFFDSSNRAKQLKVLKTLKEKKFIDAELADVIAEGVIEMLGPGIAEAVGKYDINMKDMIRFQMVSETCRKEREKRGLTFKQIALSLKVPQYRLKDVEKSRLKNIKVDILENYIDYLDLRRWFNVWKKNNLDVYKRIQE